MEKFKEFTQITEIDRAHLDMGVITGRVYSLELMHEFLSQEILNDAVPDDIHGQFNVAKNMAIYSYFCAALAPEVQLKTYTLIEHALRLKAASDKQLTLKRLLILALENDWISDSGFRHIENPSSDNHYCKTLVDVLPRMRNGLAHGSNMLVPDCLGHISKCSDFINQLFPKMVN